jgi:hypothetical protein
MAGVPESRNFFAGRIDVYLFQSGHFAPIFEV